MHSAGHHEENLFLNELDLGSISCLLYLRFPPFCFPVGHLPAQSIPLSLPTASNCLNVLVCIYVKSVSTQKHRHVQLDRFMGL